MNNRFAIQVITSLIFFWAAFGIIKDTNLFQVIIAAAAAYVWFSNDYKFEVPRAKVRAMLNKNKTPKDPWDNQLRR